MAGVAAQCAAQVSVRVAAGMMLGICRGDAGVWYLPTPLYKKGGMPVESGLYILIQAAASRTIPSLKVRSCPMKSGYTFLYKPGNTFLIQGGG